MSILITYWSLTGNTEIMAKAIYEGIKSITNNASIKSIDEINPKEVKNYEKVLFGSPAMGAEDLDRDFYLPWYELAEMNLTNQLVGLFGSFGWGGDWLIKWESRVKKNKLNLFKKSIAVNSSDIDDCYNECFLFGQEFAKSR